MKVFSKIFTKDDVDDHLIDANFNGYSLVKDLVKKAEIHNPSSSFSLYTPPTNLINEDLSLQR
jgi:hypothetical protein